MELEEDAVDRHPDVSGGLCRLPSAGYLVMQEYFPGNYAYLEIVWLFGGINVFMMTFPVFVIVQKWIPGLLLSCHAWLR